MLLLVCGLGSQCLAQSRAHKKVVQLAIGSVHMLARELLACQLAFLKETTPAMEIDLLAMNIGTTYSPTELTNVGEVLGVVVGLFEGLSDGLFVVGVIVVGSNTGDSDGITVGIVVGVKLGVLVGS